MELQSPPATVVSVADYKRVLAAKEEALARLEEAYELLQLRDEQIDILRKKAASAVELQSKLDNVQYEIEYLQDTLAQSERQVAAVTLREQQLLEELKEYIPVYQQCKELQEQLQHMQTYNKLLQKEADEFAQLNKELTEELRLIPALKSELHTEQGLTRRLQHQLELAEKKNLPRN